MLNFLIFAAIGTGLGIGISLLLLKNEKQAAKSQADLLIKKANTDSAELKKEIKTRVEQRSKQLTSDLEDGKERLNTIEKRLVFIEKQGQKWDQKIEELSSQERKTSEEIKQLEQLSQETARQQIESLKSKTGINETDAVNVVTENFIAVIKENNEASVQKEEVYLKEAAPKLAKKLIQNIMNRYTEPSSVDHPDNVITVNDNTAVGRIIGKEGRNINYFEAKSGVSVVFNDQAPNQITLSCFNMFRRELAKRALAKLVRQKAINEQVIDAALAQASDEMDIELTKLGKFAAKEIELPQDKWDPELLKLIGRLRYRTSYGQNILYHSLEIGFFCAMMAAEIGADVEVAKMAGFFHDLGKAIDQEEGETRPHDLISKDLLEKFGFSWEIVHAAWVHHDAEPSQTVEAELVKAADAISASRPGARAESSEDYYARIAALENYAMETEAADKVLIMSAGREVRLYVDPDKIADEGLFGIAEQLADKIENNLSFPGKIKVNLVREVKAIDFAKEQAFKTS